MSFIGASSKGFEIQRSFR